MSSIDENRSISSENTNSMDSAINTQNFPNQLGGLSMSLRKRTTQTQSVPSPKTSLNDKVTSKPTVKQQKNKKPVCQCSNCNTDESNKIRDSKGNPLHLCHYPGCEKDFSRAGNLLRHLDWHKGILNFVCQYCDMRFTSRRNLNAHVKTHANVIPNKPNDNIVNEQLSLTKQLVELTLKNNSGTQSHQVEYEKTGSEALSSSSLTKNVGIDNLDVDPTITENPSLTVKTDYFEQEFIPSSVDGQVSECYSKLEESVNIETENFNDSDHYMKSVSSAKPNQITKDSSSTPPTYEEQKRYSCSDEPYSNSHVSFTDQTQLESQIPLPLIEELLKEKLKVSDLIMKNANSNNQVTATCSSPSTPVTNIKNVYVTVPDTIMMLPVWDSVSNSQRLIPVALSESNMSFTIPVDTKRYFDNPDSASEAPLNAGENQSDKEISLPPMQKLNDSLNLDKVSVLEFQALKNYETTESQCTNFNDDGGNETILSEMKLNHGSHIPDSERTYSEEQQGSDFTGYLEDQYRKLEDDNNTKISNDEKPYRESSNFEKQYRKINDINNSINKKPYVYNIPDCGKTFGYLHTLQRHIEWHTGKKKFFCKHCDKAFMRKDHMVSHYNYVHSNSKQDTLNYTRDDINEKSMSTNDKTYYACQFSDCGKFFERVDFLERHLKEHSGKQNFIPVQCEEEFTSKDRLANHVEKVHINPKQEESIIIDQVAPEEKFSVLSGEAKYVCNIPNCNKVFGYPHTLRRHLEWHRGVKKFFCPYCNKGFGRKDHLVGHVRVHTNAKQKELNDSKVGAEKRIEFLQKMLKQEGIDSQVSQDLFLAKTEIP